MRHLDPDDACRDRDAQPKIGWITVERPSCPIRTAERQHASKPGRVVGPLDPSLDLPRLVEADHDSGLVVKCLVVRPQSEAAP